MPAFSQVVFGAATIATLLFIPLVLAVHHATGPDAAGGAIAIPFLGVLRLGALAAALLLASASGRMDGLADSAGGRAALLIGAAVFVEVVSQFLHFLSIDYKVPVPYSTVFAVLATAVPLALLSSAIAAGRAREVYWGSVGLAVAAGFAMMLIYSPLAAKYQENRAREIQETEEQEAKSIAGLAQVPEGADVAQLTAHLHARDSWTVQHTVLRRIRATEGHLEALTAMLTGDRRAEALYALHFDAKDLPDEARDECWKAAGVVAGDLVRRLEKGESPDTENVLLLLRSAKSLGEIRDEVRMRHAAELELTVRAGRLAEEKRLGSRELGWLEMYLAEVRRAAQ